MTESFPIKSVSESEARVLSPEEIKEAQEAIENPVPLESAPNMETQEQDRVHAEEVRNRLARAAEKPIVEPQEVHSDASTQLMEAQKSAIESELAKYENPKDRVRAARKLNKAIDLVHQGKLDKADRTYYGGALRDVIGAQIKLLAANGNMPALKKIAENNALLNIYPENLRLLPKEILSSPKLQAKVWKRIEDALFHRGIFKNSAGDAGIDKLRTYQEQGILTPTTVQSVAQSSRFQNMVAKNIQDIFKRGLKGYATDPYGNAQIAIERFVSGGLLPKERADEILNRLH